MLQNTNKDRMLTMAALRNRLLLPEAEFAPKVVDGDEDALHLVKPTATGTLWGVAAPPSTDGGSYARRSSRLASTLNEGQHPHTGARQSAPGQGLFSPIFIPPWRLPAYPPATNIPQAVLKNARTGS